MDICKIIVDKVEGRQLGFRVLQSIIMNKADKGAPRKETTQGRATSNTVPDRWVDKNGSYIKQDI